jgi:hydroxymethylpyrimidine pyrophosphatase-like HAD family hydrolase
MPNQATSTLRNVAEIPVQSERQPTIAVDFDGVLAEYDGWKGNQVLGEPRVDVVEVLRVLRQEGWKIIIHTTRSEAEIRDYLVDNQIPYDEVNRNSSYRSLGNKPVATVYWDDRALCYSGNAFHDLDAIRSFRTWSGRK